jgi:ABC-type transporter lipoprotein component MlaA
MFRNNKRVFSLVLLFCLTFNLLLPVFATDDCKYCDFGNLYVGEDKFEGFNRKMFDLNSKLNKFIARPVHILWSSIMPKYGIDRIQSVYNNIEYPKRLASCLLQKDGSGNFLQRGLICCCYSQVHYGFCSCREKAHFI